MANHKSAEKRARQNDKKRLQNRRIVTNMRGRIKELRAAIEAGEKDNLATMLATTIRLISRAGAKGTIHRKKASRLISRLTKAAAE